MKNRDFAYKQLAYNLADFERVDAKKHLFKSAILASKFHCKNEYGKINSDAEKHKSDWDIETQRLLIKCCRPNNCYPAYCNEDNLFKLRTFTLTETDEQFKYLYHSSNTPPEIILNEGLKLRYSFNLLIGFPPLIFLSTDKRSWSGKYKYRVELHQSLYFDTNLNYQCRKGNDWFCVKQNIKPQHIVLVE